jgi:hypothetical protein
MTGASDNQAGLAFPKEDKWDLSVQYIQGTFSPGFAADHRQH